MGRVAEETMIDDTSVGFQHAVLFSTMMVFDLENLTVRSFSRLGTVPTWYTRVQCYDLPKYKHYTSCCGDY